MVRAVATNKIWPRPGEERLKMASVYRRKTGDTTARDGVLTTVEGGQRKRRKRLTLPGNYPAYYACSSAIPLNGNGENPVPAKVRRFKLWD